MTEIADESDFLAALNGAGWNPGRRTSTKEVEAGWAARGYTPSMSGVAFVSEFDRLTLMYPKHPSIGGEQELKLDALTATASIHSNTVRAYERRVNEALVPVGMAASHHLILLISESGKLYGGYDSFLALYGDTGMVGIRNIYQRIKGVRMPLALGCHAWMRWNRSFSLAAKTRDLRGGHWRLLPCPGGVPDGYLFRAHGAPIRLEITETEVRAKEGWARAPLGKKEVLRSEIRSIHYLQRQISFRGVDGQSLLDGPPRQRLEEDRSLGIPLDADRAGELLL